jgi:hypothetical protein
MLIELTIAAFIAAYIAIVILGHVLVVVAILRGLREGSIGGRPKKLLPSRDGSPRKTKPLPVRWVLAKDRPPQGDLYIGRRHVSIFRVSAPLNFAEQKQALAHDLRYVATVAAGPC